MNNKKNYTLAGLLILILCAGLCINIKITQASSSVRIDKKHFSKYMMYFCENEFDSNNDGFLSRSEIGNAKELIDLRYEQKGYINIDFKGIEYLTSLEKIELEGVRIKNFNIYNLHKLKAITLSNCKMHKNESIKCDDLKLLEEMNFNSTDIKYKGDFRYNTKLKSLNLHNSNVNKIAISKLKRLEYFEYCGDMNKINLKNNKKLKKLVVFAPMKTIDLSNNKELELLSVSLSRMKKFDIDLKNNKSLKELYIDSDVCTYIDISGHDKLKILEIEAPLTDVNVTDNKTLRTLKIKANLQSINLSGNEKLKVCSIDSPLQSIDFEVANLKRLELTGINMDELKINNDSLAYIDINDCVIRVIDISVMKSIKNLSVKGGRVNKIIVSGDNTDIKQIYAEDCKGLAEIELGDCDIFKEVTYCETIDGDAIDRPLSELLDVDTKTVILKPDVHELYVN